MATKVTLTFKLVKITLPVTNLLTLVTHILIIKNGQFGGKYIFKTDYFDVQIVNINDTETIQD